MPWYKFEAQHGPGHQSNTINYEWYDDDEQLTKEEQREEWECKFRDCDYPIGKVTKLRKLPEHIIKSKIKMYKDDIEHAKEMLKILKC